MSPETMNYIYFATIALVGFIMYKTPGRFLGKAKYDEGAIKAEGLIKKCGIALIVFMLILTLYHLFLK